MQDAALVSVVNGAGDGRHQVGHLVRIVGQAGRQLGQAAAFDKLHTEIGLALVLADAVDRHDVGMVQASGVAGLAEQEFADLRGRAMPAVAQHLQGHLPLRSILAGTVDHTHAATSQVLQDHVVVDPRAGRQNRLPVRNSWGQWGKQPVQLGLGGQEGLSLPARAGYW